MPEDVAVVAAAMRPAALGEVDRGPQRAPPRGRRRPATNASASRRGFAADGTLCGLHARLEMDQGAYPGFPIGAAMFTRIMKTMMPGPYRVPAYRFDIARDRVEQGDVLSRTAVPGRWRRGCVSDSSTSRRRELGIGRDEIRLRNMVAADELPTAMITGPTLDVRMSARATLEQALARRGVRSVARAAGGGARGRPRPRARVRDLHRGRARAAGLRRVRHAGRGRVRRRRADPRRARGGRQRHRLHPADAARPESRDDARPGGRRRARRVRRAGARALRRHRDSGRSA